MKQPAGKKKINDKIDKWERHPVSVRLGSYPCIVDSY